VDDRRAEILRRCLLGLATALVVVRPLVLGEDPGMLNRLTSTAGLVLSMLWLVTAVAWAAWRAWFRQGVGFGAVELGLAGVVVLEFVSAFAAARYQHPALLIAGEWFVLLLVFGMVRQLARDPADNRSLLAAVLAMAVSLSVHAVYQAAVELPQSRRELSDPEVLRRELAKIDVILAPDDPHIEFWKKRVAMDHVFATYAHPNAFAGYLALLLPAAAGYSLWGWRKLGSDWRVILALVCTGWIAVALWLTHSRGGIVGVLLAGGTALAIAGWRSWWPYRMVLLTGLLGIVLAVLVGSRTEPGAALVEKARGSFGLRTEYWSATCRMIGDHVWLGVGAGNFGRLYPRYMAATAVDKVQDPHNFALEIWATAGVFALLLFLLTLGLFFRQIGSAIRRPLSVVKDRADLASFAASRPTDYKAGTTDHGPRLPLAFYLGGMGALILGFLLRAGDLSADELAHETIMSLVRGLVWFLAFAVFSSIPWSGVGCTLALAAGVAALLLNLCVSGGIAWPSVAQPLWVMAALALASIGNGVDRAPSAAPPQQPSTRYSVLHAQYALVWRFLPLPLLAGLAVVYFLYIFLPITTASAALTRAQLHYGDNPRLPGWRNNREPRWQGSIQHAANDRDKVEAAASAGTYLQENILKPLETAAAADPRASYLPLELYFWYVQQWKVLASAPGMEERAEQLAVRALGNARRAQKLDPDSKEGYRSEYDLYKRLAVGHPGREKYFLGLAARALREVVVRDPVETSLHYELAELLFHLDDPVGARHEAERARELDALAIPARQLKQEQRKQVEQWLAKSAG
jgi:O-Antigen ligase